VSLARCLVLIRYNFRLLADDLASLLSMLFFPFIMMFFLQPAGRVLLQSSGYRDASGAEQVVPGMVVLFVFLGMSFTGSLFFQEHSWRTWDRLRASVARPLEIIIGKCTPPFVLTLVQVIILFGAGFLIFGMQTFPSLPLLGLMMLALCFCQTGLAMAWIALSRSFSQFLILSNLLGMLFCGLGGSLVPPEALPGWAAFLAPASPAYWALRGFRTLLLDGGDLFSYLQALLVLLGIGSAALLLAALRFRFADVKEVTI